MVWASLTLSVWIVLWLPLTHCDWDTAGPRTSRHYSAHYSLSLPSPAQAPFSKLSGGVIMVMIMGSMGILRPWLGKFIKWDLVCCSAWLSTYSAVVNWKYYFLSQPFMLKIVLMLMILKIKNSERSWNEFFSQFFDFVNARSWLRHIRLMAEWREERISVSGNEKGEVGSCSPRTKWGCSRIGCCCICLVLGHQLLQIKIFIFKFWMDL